MIDLAKINKKISNRFLIKIAIFFLFSGSNIMSKTFTVTDPPMVYIYHFVSYDTTDVVFHGGVNQSENKKLRLPLFNKRDLNTSSNLIIGKALDPKLVSAMVTSAVAENIHVNIAGESIQNRIKTDNFIKILKSSDYPKRTDYIFIGEINTIASQYEIDLKLIDVSTQKIVASNEFNLPFTNLSNLRTKINEVVGPLMSKIVNPFLGSAYVRVDSTSREKIRWDALYIRPLKTVVGSDIKKTFDSDYEAFKTSSMPLSYMETHGGILSAFSTNDYRLVSDFNNNSFFLEGNYRLKVFLKNNEDPFEIDFKVKPGDLNEIHVALSYTPPPKDSDNDGIPDENDACPDIVGPGNPDPEKNGCPPPKLFGNIVFKNIWDGVGFELKSLSDKGDTLVLYGKRINDALVLSSGSYKTSIAKDKTSFTVLGLPMGDYIRNSWAITEEKFPGKHYLNLFSDRDSLKIDKGEVTLNTTIQSNKITKGREIVIYFNPFTPDELDEYVLYLDENIVPYTKASIAGELHITGFPISFEGDLFIERKGYEIAQISVSKGTEKAYFLAELTRPKEEDVIQRKIGSLWK
jgi:hypothetical protein